MIPTNDSQLTNSMDSFHFGTPPTKTEDAMDVPFASFDDDLDHRKRRRNRTTQSCWSCHQAKRKCDRKRPCSRCIQLGLTGLCVYETDDPASRDDPTLSETQRLRKRIAELEALVREMKNKPHPRWADKVQSGNIGVDKWHTRAKYVVGSGAGGTSPGGVPGVDGFDEYHYRFPPLDDAAAAVAAAAAAAAAASTNGYDPSSFPSSSNGTVLPPPPPFDDSRRLSIASSVSSSSSPRTPYSYHAQHHAQHHNPHGHHGHNPHAHAALGGAAGMLANPCACLAATPATARALAHAVRGVVLESGLTHPYSEGCRVLALVRELEAVADGGSGTNGAGSSSNNNNNSNGNNNGITDSHSGSGSPHPPSSSTSAGSSPMSHASLLQHAITPPTPPAGVSSHSRGGTGGAPPHISYFPTTTISTLTSLTYGAGSGAASGAGGTSGGGGASPGGQYGSPGSDDGHHPQHHPHHAHPHTHHSHQHTHPHTHQTHHALGAPMSPYADFGVGAYASSPHSASPAKTHHGHTYPLGVA